MIINLEKFFELDQAGQIAEKRMMLSYGLFMAVISILCLAMAILGSTADVLGYVNAVLALIALAMMFRPARLQWYFPSWVTFFACAAYGVSILTFIASALINFGSL